MVTFQECLYGPLEDIGDTGPLDDHALRALVQNLCGAVVRLQNTCAEMQRHIQMLEESDE